MRKITVAVDDEAYRRARLRAAREKTSVSALVRSFLKEVGETEADCLKREEALLRDRVGLFKAVERFERDTFHERSV